MICNYINYFSIEIAQHINIVSLQLKSNWGYTLLDVIILQMQSRSENLQWKKERNIWNLKPSKKDKQLYIFSYRFFCFNTNSSILPFPTPNYQDWKIILDTGIILRSDCSHLTIQIFCVQQKSTMASPNKNLSSKGNSHISLPA